MVRKYQIIYADPPWSYSVSKNTHGGRSKNKHYSVPRYVDLLELPIKDLSDTDCVLFMWATSSMLPEALYLMKHWGFDYKTVGFTWVKKNKKANSLFWGMGSWTRANAEYCLIGVKGNIVRKNANVHSVIESIIEEHSKKPKEAIKRITDLMGDLPRIELFARQKKEGWDVWGNEVISDIKL